MALLEGVGAFMPSGYAGRVYCKGSNCEGRV
jgi:hypothetical protein